MTKSCSSLILCGLFIGAAATATANTSLQTTLQARYAAMKVAMGMRDSKAVASLLAPSFVSIDVSGQSENASQMIQEVGALPKDPLKVSTTTLLSVKPIGNTAVVEQRYDMKTTKTAPDGTKRNIELITLSTDTWVNSNGTWLMQKTETEQLDYYVDGQRVAHKIHS